jgi:peroxiredoxin Q/BCP
MVVGISRDSVASHCAFRDKFALSFPLLADEEGAMCEAYGAWVEKNMYGKKYMGIERSTFLVDETGTLRRIWRKVKAEGHAAEVLAAVRAL